MDLELQRENAGTRRGPTFRSDLELVRFDLGKARAGERLAVHDLRLALHSFVDHCALSAAGLTEGEAPRRAPIVSRTRGVEVVLKPVAPAVARKWLLDRAREILLEAHAYFLPIEAVLRVPQLFTEGSARLEEHFESSIELVRTKWEGGRSR